MTLLFTEKEWNDAMPGLTKSMTDYLRPYRTGVFEHFTNDGDEWAEGWGSGSYLRVGDSVHVLTNEHVSSVMRAGRKLTYQFDDQDDIRLFAGIYADLPAPFDIGLLPVAMSAWDLGFNRWMQHIKLCLSRRSVADEAKTQDLLL